MSEASKRRLQLGAQSRQKRSGPPPAESKRVPVPPPVHRVETSEERDEIPLVDRRRKAVHPGPSPMVGTSDARHPHGKGPVVDLEAGPVPKRARVAETPRATFVADEEGASSEAVNVAVPPKTVHFANHMILGAQMELSEIDELPKKHLRDEAGRAFRLQASANMDMWLCVKRAIMAAERAKRAYDDARARFADVEKKRVMAESCSSEAERRAKELEDALAVAKVVAESGEATVRDAVAAKEAIQVVLEDSERSKGEEIDAAVRKAVAEYRASEDFTTLLDQEVGNEMADLIFRFKRFNPGQKLNLNFLGEFPPLPEGLSEEAVEAYEGEDALPEEAAAAVEVSEAADVGSPM